MKRNLSRDTERAMSEENVDVVRRGFESFQQGGPEAFLEAFSDDAVTYRHQPDGATFHGKAGFRDAAADCGQRTSASGRAFRRRSSIWVGRSWFGFSR